MQGQTDQEKEKLAKTENSQKNSQWKASQEAFPSSEISSKWAFNEFAKQQEEQLIKPLESIHYLRKIHFNQLGN